MRKLGRTPGVGRDCRWGTVRPCSRRERFPADWKDPLELYGRFGAELTAPVFDAASERRQVKDQVGRRGAEWVWANRHRLVSLRKFLSRAQARTFAGRPGRSAAIEVRHGSKL